MKYIHNVLAVLSTRLKKYAKWYKRKFIFDLDSRTVVIEQPSHSCKLCGKSFWNRDSMYKHMNMHKGTTQCPVCHKVLSRTTHMKRHLKNRHGWLGMGSIMEAATAASSSSSPGTAASGGSTARTSSSSSSATAAATQASQSAASAGQQTPSASADSSANAAATFTTIRIRESSVERITSSPIP